jgi:excisionase family DNA binding protein
MVNKKDYYSITELAGIMGISRVAIFKKIKKGEISAIRIGRIYAIPVSQLGDVIDQDLSSMDKNNIDRAVEKTVKEFGKTLELLGNA